MTFFVTAVAATRNCEELFADARVNAGVMFASIPNFTEFYSEDINEGVECIRKEKIGPKIFKSGGF
jgi:adenylate cyclase 8